MKALRNLNFFLVFAMVASCNQENKTNDPELLKKVLSDYFDGIKNKDLNKMNSATTADFILFEDGKVWNNDSLFNFIKTFESFEGTWTFDYLRVSTDEMSADVVYLNHGDFVFNDTTRMKFDWVESATFKKVDGSWRMDLLHSTIRK